MEKVVMEPIKKSIWDYLFYASLIVLTIWLILKVTGVINTPLWLEYGVPIGSAIIVILTFFQSLNDKFYRIFDEMSDLRSNVARIDGKIVHIDRDLERVKDALFAK